MSRQQSARGERGIVKFVALAVVVIVAAGGFGVWWYFIRDSAPAKAKLTTRATVNPTSGPDGSWNATAGATTFAGFRIDEKFGPLAHTAVVRTPKVTGTFALAGTAITKTTITADLTALESKDDAPKTPAGTSRLGFLHVGGLETNTFPNATFVQTGAIALPSAPTTGSKLRVHATGNLTLHGVTKPVTIPIEASWNGAVIDITGSLPVELADYGMTPPSLGFVDVSGAGTLELEITFAKT